MGCEYSEDVEFGCDIVWLDPEPHPDDPGYAKYQEDFLRLAQADACSSQRCADGLGDAQQTTYVQNLRRRLVNHGRSLYAGFTHPPTREEYRALCISLGGRPEGY